MNKNENAPWLLEVASAILVPAALAGFSRVFLDTSALIPLVAAALASSGLSIVLRRLRVPLLPAIMISMVVLVLAIVAKYTPQSTQLGLVPTGESYPALRLLIDDLLIKFRDLKAPVASESSFLAAGVFGAWIMASLTDWGALRLRLAFEPVIPAGLLFIFSSVLGDGLYQLTSTAIFVIAVGIWATTQRTVNLADRGGWLPEDRRRGLVGVARAGAIGTAMAIFVGLLVGPQLPAANAEEVVKFRTSGDPTRVVQPPFVDIEARLVNQSDVALFTVATDSPQYWRLAGLDTFEGNVWKLFGSFTSEDSELPGSPFQGEVQEVNQTFNMQALATDWAPAAFAPSKITDVQGTALTWNTESSSLIVAKEQKLSRSSYSLESAVPVPTLEELQTASENVPEEFATRYLDSPADLTPRIASEAETITAGANSRYEQMIALQNHFRTFDYSLELSPTEGDPFDHFLDTRVGFCQQFSATFALMARSLGAPARVAVGFTWGEPAGQDETGKTIYQVTGRQAHAWPEVWFEGLGWIAFEPTPGRGNPSSVNYSGLGPEQDALTPTEIAPPVDSALEAPAPEPPAPEDQALAEPPLADPEPSNVEAAEEVGSEGGFRIPWLYLGILGLITAYIFGVPALRTLQFKQRREQATTFASQIEIAWAEAVEAIGFWLGLGRLSSETRQEFAVRIAGVLPNSAQDFSLLADAATKARFNPIEIDRNLVSQAQAAATFIVEQSQVEMSWWQKQLRILDPRRFLRSALQTVQPDTTHKVEQIGPNLDLR